MGTAKLAQCLSPAPLPQASKEELGHQVRETMRNPTNNGRRAVPLTKTGATPHAESMQVERVPKLSDEEWLAQ
jgi:hypothetical protein